MNDKDSPEQVPPNEAEISIDARIDALVGNKLRVYFDSLLQGDVPDRIVELIAVLSEKEKRTAGEKNP